MWHCQPRGFPCKLKGPHTAVAVASSQSVSGYYLWGGVVSPRKLIYSSVVSTVTVFNNKNYRGQSSIGYFFASATRMEANSTLAGIRSI